MTEKQTEALEKLNRGIQESKYAAQQQTMKLAQDYFDDSTKTLKQQIKEDRATLEDLPDQIPGGQEAAFQAIFQELMENFTAMEERIDEAQKNVSNLDPEQIRRQGEVDATDAARREARELDVDLTEVEASGSGGRIIVSDVVEASKDATRREAEELGVDLSQVEGEGSGPGGLITVEDVRSMAEEAQEQATGGTGQAAQEAQDTAGDTAQQVQDAAGQAAGQAQETAEGAAQQAQEAAGQATDQAGQAVQGAQEAAGQVTDQATGVLGGVTDQVGQAAQGVQDTAGQATQQAQETAGQATQQAQDAAGQVTEQAAGEDEEPKATNAAKRKAEALGVDLSEVQGSGAGGLITISDVTGS